MNNRGQRLNIFYCSAKRSETKVIYIRTDPVSPERTMKTREKHTNDSWTSALWGTHTRTHAHTRTHTNQAQRGPETVFTVSSVSAVNTIDIETPGQAATGGNSSSSGPSMISVIKQQLSGKTFRRALLHLFGAFSVWFLCSTGLRDGRRHRVCK